LAPSIPPERLLRAAPAGVLHGARTTRHAGYRTSRRIRKRADAPIIMAITGHTSITMLDRCSHPRRTGGYAALAKLAAASSPGRR
jgi:hypothetical protein